VDEDVTLWRFLSNAEIPDNILGIDEDIENDTDHIPLVTLKEASSSLDK